MAASQNVVSVANGSSIHTYAALYTYALNVYTAMLANAITFSAPTPTLITFFANITALKAAMVAWGRKGARGTHAQHLALMAAKAAVISNLAGLVEYVQGVARRNPNGLGAQQAIVALAAMRIKNTNTPIGSYGPPFNVRQILKKNLINSTNIYLRWEKPQMSNKIAKPKAYSIFMSTDGINFLPLATVTKTNYTFSVGTSGTIRYFKVAALGAVGVSTNVELGAISDVLTARSQ